jgi:hypothetical protein
MTTPAQDPTFQPGCYVFGCTIPGMGTFGAAKAYPQRAVFGAGTFGSQIPGKNEEDDMFPFIFGAPTPREKGPWAETPFMNPQVRGRWIKRAVFYTWRGRQMVRRYRPYDGMPKDHLATWSIKLRSAVLAWQSLTAASKVVLNAEASRLGLRYSGYNYFISLYVKDDPKWQAYT